MNNNDQTSTERNTDLSVTALTSIRHAMIRLDQTAEKCLFVVDAEDKLIGALTDGNVRRAILSGASLDQSIEVSFHPNPIAVICRDGESPSMVRAEAIKLMRKHRIEVVPIIDPSRHIIGYLTWSDAFGDDAPSRKEPIDAPVIIMAGGLGTRLEPFTQVLPKPLIPVHNKPIIEHIIDRFVDVGVSNFWLTVNYKSRILKAYFLEREQGYAVNFIEETEPLGTAGGLASLRDTVTDAFFVSNCDIIVNADYRSLLKFHKNNKYLITLVASTVDYQIPYGTCVLDDSGTLSRINEKPHYDFLVNTGLYVLEPKALELIPEQTKYHMTDLIEDVMRAGARVGVFPISEDAWVDVGQWAEYRRAVERLELA